MNGPRFWVNWTADETTVVPAVEKALGHPVVGIVDEKAGGMVAYAAPEAANQIVAVLNAVERVDEL